MSAEANPFAAFEGQKYLSLETFRKNGEGVRTPIWFAAEKDGGAAVLYIYTIADTGKVKRIRNNPRVRIAPCDMRGNVTGGLGRGAGRDFIWGCDCAWDAGFEPEIFSFEADYGIFCEI